MTFLTLAQRIHLLIRSGESEGGSVPTATTGQVGLLNEIVTWVNMAYQDIQNDTEEWAWRMGRGVIHTVANERTLNPATALLDYERIAPFQTGGYPYLLTSTALISNGTFASDTIWTKGVGWTITGGVGVGTATSGRLSQSVTLVEGQTYEITFTLVSRSGGSVRIEFSGTGNSVTGSSRTVVGTYTETLTAVEGNTTFWFDATGFTGTIDNVAISTVDHQFLNYVPYEDFRGRYDRATTTTRPGRYTIRPDETIELDPTPDAVYAITLDYRKALDVLSGDSDVPLIQTRFQEAIVWKAILYYCITRDSTAELYKKAEREYRRVMGAMAREQLPAMNLVLDEFYG